MHNDAHGLTNRASLIFSSTGSQDLSRKVWKSPGVEVGQPERHMDTICHLIPQAPQSEGLARESPGKLDSWSMYPAMWLLLVSAFFRYAMFSLRKRSCDLCY